MSDRLDKPELNKLTLVHCSETELDTKSLLDAESETETAEYEEYVDESWALELLNEALSQPDFREREDQLSETEASYESVESVQKETTPPEDYESNQGGLSAIQKQQLDYEKRMGAVGSQRTIGESGVSVSKVTRVVKRFVNWRVA